MADNFFRITKIICTLGPKTSSIEAIRKLVENGMSAARLNFSHADHQFHKNTIENIKEIRNKLGHRYLSIGLDTKGPEIRLGNLSKSISVSKGDNLILTNDETIIDESKNILYFDLENLQSIKNNCEIMIDDGILKLKVIEVNEKSVKTVAMNSHKISSKKGINIPGVHLTMPSLTKKDIADIKFGLENEVDFIFASFINTEEDVIRIRKIFAEYSHKPLLFSKIETLNAISNIDAIIEKSDGIMIARGDLGAEIGLEKLFFIQQMITEKCKLTNKPFIIATQILESMNIQALPTRAEVSDIGNSVLDGADCIMLSSETASGNFPFESVNIMSHISFETEKWLRKKSIENVEIPITNIYTALTINKMSRVPNVRTVVIFTDDIKEVLDIKSAFLSIPIIVASQDESMLRKISILRGCLPYHVLFNLKTGDSDFKHRLVDEVIYVIKNMYFLEEKTNIIVYYRVSQNETVFKMIKV
ncbi:pyruvate kinase [Hamiltosporidium magnivora]|uniref:Pyruvate kinase n=1 Tax=Hamiltosporidium magnivora TaxID=148818 RepID=A0A4Q9L9R6_9MICR|nr:pyruvate kinase [Hamiltosporidium magnivora]